MKNFLQDPRITARWKASCLCILFLYLSQSEGSPIRLVSVCASRTSTVFDLITADTPISAQSSNSVVFRLQPVYFLKANVVGTDLNCIGFFSYRHSKVLVVLVLCRSLWLQGFFSCSVLFVVLLLFWVDHIWHFDPFVREKRAGRFVLRCCVMYDLSKSVYSSSMVLFVWLWISFLLLNSTLFLSISLLWPVVYLLVFSLIWFRKSKAQQSGVTLLE